MDKKDKEKEKEKEKNKSTLKKLHKNSLKKFLSDETVPSGSSTSGDASSNGSLTKSPSSADLSLSEKEKEKLSKKNKKLSKKKLALQQQQAQQAQQAQLQQQQAQQQQLKQQSSSLNNNNQKKFNINEFDDDDDDDDDDYDDDDDSSDDESTTSIATSIALTPKELYNNVVNRQRIKYTGSINFTALQEAIQFAHDDSTHIIFIVHCVDWYFQSRNLASNIEETFTKDKNVLYFFIDATSLEYKKEFPGEIAGVPIISIYYRQKPFKIKRDTLQFDWEEQERIKASYTSHQLKELLDICKQAIESYDPDNNIEISIDF